MSFVFERVIRETLEVETVIRHYVPYRAFSRIRKDKPNCGFCSRAFGQEDDMNLAFVKGKRNEMICDECAQKAIAGGAKESRLSQS